VACPEGITRSAVLQLADEVDVPVSVGDFSLPQLYAADEAFVTGTMGELAPVLRVDGRTIGTGEPGEITGRLRKAFADVTATSGVQVVG
jgi:branched-chain amino acid aminotransferase